MAVRPVLAIGHPVLRRVADLVPPDAVTSTAVQELVDDLIDTMRAEAGAGIAAPQIGVPLRVTTIEVTDNPRYPYKPPIPLTVAINPELEPLDDELVGINEGCLSVPLRGVLQRHVNVRVRYLDREGGPHEQVVRGLTAGTWQHEVDHLHGRLIVDRIDPRTLATWEMFEAHQREAFVERITAFVERVGS